MPILADVESIASNLNTRTVTLSPLSVAVLFSTLDAANRLYDWQGAGSSLTPTEIDQIDAFLSQARYELMTTLVGQVIAWGGENAPPNCLLCDGTGYLREDYPELYGALNNAFIVDADHFIVPDLRGRFVYGAAALGAIGTTGGEESHTLTEGEMPGHTHTIPFTATTLAVEPGEVTVLTPVPILTANTGSAGGSGSHNNMPPFMTLAYYIVTD